MNTSSLATARAATIDASTDTESGRVTETDEKAKKGTQKRDASTLTAARVTTTDATLPQTPTAGKSPRSARKRRGGGGSHRGLQF